MKSLLVTFGICGIAGLVPAPALAQCAAGYVEVAREKRADAIHIWCVEDGDLPAYRRNEARLGELQRRVPELDAALQKIDETLGGERERLTKMVSSSREIEADCEAWVALTADARKKANEAALNALATLLLARVEQIGKDKTEIAKGQLDQLYKEWQGSILSTLAIRNAKEHRIVEPLRQWQTTEAFLKDLKKITTIASSADAASKGEALRALAKLGSIALNDQKAKVLVADVDFMLAAVYKNGASWTAEKRIQQLLELSEENLDGVRSFTAVYRTHVDGRKKLTDERAALEAERKPLEADQRMMRGDFPK